MKFKVPKLRIFTVLVASILPILWLFWGVLTDEDPGFGSFLAAILIYLSLPLLAQVVAAVIIFYRQQYKSLHVKGNLKTVLKNCIYIEGISLADILIVFYFFSQGFEGNSLFSIIATISIFFQLSFWGAGLGIFCTAYFLWQDWKKMEQEKAAKAILD